jgi:GT2 family glycosyltransferase
VWLLHDDCEPEPDALEQLLLGADQVPAVAVLGPKVMDWSDRDVLLEAGVGIDRAGRRITGIEPREVDQGQHDGNRDVLGVGSAGMLVRRDVWNQVGGFDPGMLLYREDVDFCWRVQAAGYRVRVITDAVVYHVEASARRRRQASAAPRRGREDRRNALLVLVGNLPPGPMLFALAGNLVLSMLRTVFFLFAKRAGAALDELAGFLGAAGHPLRLLAARRRRSRGRRGAYARLRSEVPPGHSVRKLAEFATGALSKSLPVDMVGSHRGSQRGRLAAGRHRHCAAGAHQPGGAAVSGPHGDSPGGGAFAAQHQPARWRRARPRLGRCVRAVVGVPARLPPGRDRHGGRHAALRRGVGAAGDAAGRKALARR